MSLVTRTEVIVTLLVGFGSGLVGAFAGGWAQRWVYRVGRDDKRLDELWEYHRVLEVTAEQLMDERHGDADGSELATLERRLFRHFRYLPQNVITAIEADEAAGTHTRYEIGENLSSKAATLRTYLDQQRHPVRHRLVKAGKWMKT